MDTWYIRNGNLPYLEEFPEFPVEDIENPFSEYPNTLWKIKNGLLPYKTTFPDLKTFDDTPLAMWRIKNGLLPYKSTFPKMYTFDDTPLAMWRIDPNKQGDEYHIPWKLVFPNMYKVEKISPDAEIVVESGIRIEDYYFDIIMDCISFDIIINGFDYSIYRAKINEYKQQLSDYRSEVLEFESLIEEYNINKSIDEYADEYNALTNGNLDYHKRNFFVTSDEMHNRGWTDYPDGYNATTYYQNCLYTTDDSNTYYMLYISPILEDHNVYTPKQFGIYKDLFEGLNGNIEDILKADIHNLVGNVFVGTLTEINNEADALNESLADIKEYHLILVEKEYCEEQISITEDLIAEYEAMDTSNMPAELCVDIIAG